jgi:hypothetical protein
MASARAGAAPSLRRRARFGDVLCLRRESLRGNAALFNIRNICYLFIPNGYSGLTILQRAILQGDGASS